MVDPRIVTNGESQLMYFGKVRVNEQGEYFEEAVDSVTPEKSCFGDTSSDLYFDSKSAARNSNCG
jgi:hypothetical protein